MFLLERPRRETFASSRKRNRWKQGLSSFQTCQPAGNEGNALNRCTWSQENTHTHRGPFFFPYRRSCFTFWLLLFDRLISWRPGDSRFTSSAISCYISRAEMSLFQDESFFKCNFYCQCIGAKKGENIFIFLPPSPSPLCCPFLFCPWVSLTSAFVLFFFLLFQSNVQLTRCVSIRPGWSWVQASQKTTPTCRCAPGWSTWRRATTSLCSLNSSRQKRSLTSWRYLMVILLKMEFSCIYFTNVIVLHIGKLCVCLSGPNIYSQSMASLSGDIETPFNLTTTGHQLLLRWSSDHGTNRRGFHIRYVGEYQSMYPIYNHILLLLLHLYSKNK